MHRLSMVVLALVSALAIDRPATAATVPTVGFEETTVADEGGPALVVGIWFPATAPARPEPLHTFTQTVALNAHPDAEGLPLVVMSHGTGGWYGGHYDTALALARAGFVVAALSHTGDTYEDQSRASRIIDRPRQLHRLIDYMLKEWSDRKSVDPLKVGVFGFSAGGFTALVAAGAVADFSLLPAHLKAHPTFFDSQLMLKAGALNAAALSPAPEAFVHDDRIRAAVVAAPALGFTFGAAGLQGVRVPVQLWRAQNDHILPNPFYAEAVRAALPSPPEYHLVPDADHFDFLAPCDARLAVIAPQICTSAPTFDRAAFHEGFNAAVVAFFKTSLSPGARP